MADWIGINAMIDFTELAAIAIDELRESITARDLFVVRSKA